VNGFRLKTSSCYVVVPYSAVFAVLTLLAVLNLVALALAGESSQPAIAGDLTVSVIDVEGRLFTGELRQITPQAVQLGTTPVESLVLRDVWRLEFPAAELSTEKQNGIVFLANGDRLVSQPIRMDDENLHVQCNLSPHRSELAVPLETIRGIVLDVATSRTVRGRNRNELPKQLESSDVLILKNGDRPSGRLVRFDARSVTLETAAGESVIDRDGVRAIAFNPELISFPEVPPKRVLVSLSDGSCISGQSLTLNGDRILHLETLFGPTVEVNIALVRAIRFLGERVVALSDLKPREFRHTPFLAVATKPLMPNRSAAGGPLMLRGAEYFLGLGMHSRSKVTYDLHAEYRKFSSVVGIDDAAQGLGSVVFSVEIDGRVIYKSPLLTGRDQPLQIGPLDVTGAKQLALMVDFAARGDIRDYADWCDPILIRAD
jgi:hypothetical protein